MKTLRESEWLDQLRQRLDAYTEQPDPDMWSRISRHVNPDLEPLWVRWTSRSGSVAAVILLCFSLSSTFNDDGFVVRETDDKTGMAITGLKPDAEAPNVEHHTPVSALPENPENLHSLPVTSPRKKKAAPSVNALLVEGMNTETSDVFVSLSHVPDSALLVDTRELLHSDEAIDSAFDRKATPVPVRRRRRPIVFYGGIAASLAFQKITPFGNDGVGVGSFRSKPVFSQDRLGYTLQGGIQSRVGRRLELYAGISAYRQSQTLVYEYLSDDVVVDQDVQFEYIVKPGSARASVDYEMLNAGVQAGLIYFLNGDRLLHKFGAGLSWQHGLISAREGDSYDNSNSQYLLYQLFYRNELAVNNRMSVFVQPFYSHVLFSREQQSVPFSIKSYHAGLNFGVVLRPRR